MIPMLLKCLYLLTRELEQQYGHCHQDDQEAATRLAQDAASSLRASLFSEVRGRGILRSSRKEEGQESKLPDPLLSL